VSVGKLPLEEVYPAERRYAPEMSEFHGRCDDRNQYYRVSEQELLSSHRHSQPLSPGANCAVSGSIPRGGEVSVRRKSGIQDVTTRETRRPKEREKDRDYRRLTLTRADFPLPSPSSTGKSTGPGGDVREVSPVPSVPSPNGQRYGDQVSYLPGTQRGGVVSFTREPSPYSSDPDFEIQLVHEGRTVRHQVYLEMMVSQLVGEAAAIFRLEARTVVLMLFSGTPANLDRARTSAGPPRVVPDATVFVFAVMGLAGDHSVNLASRGGERPPPSPNTVPQMHSKLLGTFKLPKFDGTTRAWKQWDRDFVRFLGLHQLEHVLLEGFLSTFPNPEAVASNKIVYFLIEEAVLPRTLASKYVRQASLWDGHGAYLLL
jgi:hypothetical protein